MFNSDIPTIPENFNLCMYNQRWKSLSLSHSLSLSLSLSNSLIHYTHNALFRFSLSLSLNHSLIHTIHYSDGSHPFYLDVRQGGLSHGVFLKNSDPMDIILSNNAMQYKIIGGILHAITTPMSNSSFQLIM